MHHRHHQGCTHLTHTCTCWTDRGIAGYLQKYCEWSWTAADLSVMQVVYQIAMAYAAEYDERDVDAAPAPLPRRRSTLGGMACTAAVVADATGHVVHGRNLDWINATLYQPLTTELTYRRGGAVVAVTMSFFPELGPTTAVSPHVSFSYNARTVGTVDTRCLLLGQPVLEPFQLVVRQRMLADNASSTYAALVHDYTTAARLCAPAYLVFSGPGAYEGTLLTFPVKDAPRVHALSPPPVPPAASSSERELQGAADGDDPEAGAGDPRPHWYVAVANEDTEYEVAAGWSRRYNKTLALLDKAGQATAATRAGVLDRVMNVSDVLRGRHRRAQLRVDRRRAQHQRHRRRLCAGPRRPVRGGGTLFQQHQQQGQQQQEQQQQEQQHWLSATRYAQRECQRWWWWWW